MDRLWKAAGAAAWGAAALGGLQPFLSPQGAAAIQALCPGARTVLVAAFPYYAGADVYKRQAREPLGVRAAIWLPPLRAPSTGGW